MGCLNSQGQFSHWFGNIHLSGPCNRSCYFCIGQHMMALDPLNNLNVWPLKNIDYFIMACVSKGVNEVNITGSNTDPLLYKHTLKLKNYLQSKIPQLVFGVRTNGVLIKQRQDIWNAYDKASITVCSINPNTSMKMMGGVSPDIREVLSLSRGKDLKVNVVLGPENTGENVSDLVNTLDYLTSLGIKRINLREPYGQPHIGDPLANNCGSHPDIVLGMPVYHWLHNGNTCEVIYWDVHYVEVESVNLYANGKVSTTYPITKGHCDETGKVLDQSNFANAGRIREQWIYE